MNKSLVKLVGAGGMPWAVAKMSMSAVAIAVAALTAGCDASKATEEPRKQAAQLPKGFIQVKPESVKMLEIAAVADPQGVQMAWAPAHVAFVEDRVDLFPSLYRPVWWQSTRMWAIWSRPVTCWPLWSAPMRYAPVMKWRLRELPMMWQPLKRSARKPWWTRA